jgi:hypothetical protein
MTKQVSGKQAITYRNYRRARDRALVRLSHTYPDTYKQLLAIERTFDEQEGKKWIGIDGLSNLTIGTHTRANGANSHVTLTGNEGANESHNGREA